MTLVISTTDKRYTVWNVASVAINEVYTDIRILDKPDMKIPTTIITNIKLQH